jgi:hypothetical protein
LTIIVHYSPRFGHLLPLLHIVLAALASLTLLPRETLFDQPNALPGLIFSVFGVFNLISPYVYFHFHQHTTSLHHSPFLRSSLLHALELLVVPSHDPAALMAGLQK